MATLNGSPADDATALGSYIGESAAHDQDNPEGPSVRVEFASTIGDCNVETFLPNMRRTQLAFGKTPTIDTYHLIISWSSDEMDPRSEADGLVAHEAAVKIMSEALPGRQIRVRTQRDNGRWELNADGEKVWTPGKWHSHCEVANIAEAACTIHWTDARGVEHSKSYKAGRAIDGDLKSFSRLRQVVDRVVLRDLKYDNAAYVKACREFAERGETITRTDLAQRKDRGHSNYDEVRAKLRVARAQATSWSDYTARLQASGVEVQVRGATGVSYAWIGEDGVQRPARARDLGSDFTRRKVEKQCAENVATLERGGQLAVPDARLVLPAPDRSGRPQPVYQTADGKAPWRSDAELAKASQRVRATGGTYESRAAQALVTDEPVAGVALLRQDDDDVLAAVDVGDGQAVFDVDAALAQRVAEIEATQAAADGRLGEAEAAMNEAAIIQGRADAALQAAEAERQSGYDAGHAKGRAAGLAEVEDLKREAETAVETSRKAGYDAGYTEGRKEGRRAEKEVYALKVRRLADREAAAAKWETETEPALRAEIKREIEDAMQAERERAAEDREVAAEKLRELSGLTPDEATDRVLDEYSWKSKKALERYPVNAVEYDEDGKPRRVVDADGKPTVTNAWAQMRVDMAHDTTPGSDVTVGQAKRKGRQIRESTAAAATRFSDVQRQSKDKNRRQEFGQ